MWRDLQFYAGLSIRLRRYGLQDTAQIVVANGFLCKVEEGCDFAFLKVRAVNDGSMSKCAGQINFLELLFEPLT